MGLRDYIIYHVGLGYVIYLVKVIDFRWDSEGYFKPRFDRGNETFVVTMPPPNVTGSLHMGHAMFVTLEVW